MNTIELLLVRLVCGVLCKRSAAAKHKFVDEYVDILYVFCILILEYVIAW